MESHSRGVLSTWRVLCSHEWGGGWWSLPAGCEGHRHQNAFDAAVCLESKGRSSVVDEIKLDISSSSQELPLLLLL